MVCEIPVPARFCFFGALADDSYRHHHPGESSSLRSDLVSTLFFGYPYHVIIERFFLTNDVLVPPHENLGSPRERITITVARVTSLWLPRTRSSGPLWFFIVFPPVPPKSRRRLPREHHDSSHGRVRSGRLVKRAPCGGESKGDGAKSGVDMHRRVKGALFNMLFNYDVWQCCGFPGFDFLYMSLEPRASKEPPHP